MTPEQALDATVKKFEKLVKENKEPSWIIGDCPFCQKYFDFCCKKCLFEQFKKLHLCGCLDIAEELGIKNDSAEILQMLLQVRRYLYEKRTITK